METVYVPVHSGKTPAAGEAKLNLRLQELEQSIRNMQLWRGH